MNLVRETEKWSDMITADRGIDIWVLNINSGLNYSYINYSYMKVEANSDIDRSLQSGKYPAEIPAKNLKPIFEIEKVDTINIAWDSSMISGVDPDMDSDTKDLNMTIALLQ